MHKNVKLTLAVLCAVSSLAACEPTGTKGTTTSNDSSAVTTTSEEGLSTAVAVDAFTFTPPADDYSVVYPAKPKDIEQTGKTADGTSLPSTIYIAESAGMQFATAGLVGLPGTVISLGDARDGMLASGEATLKSSEPITLQGRPGLSFVGSAQSGQLTFLVRLYADEVTIYEVFVIVPGQATFDDPRVAAFFDSFRFTVDK